MTPPTAPSPYRTAPLLPRVISIRSMLSRGIEAKIDSGDIEIVDPASVDQHQRIGCRGGAEAAHVHHAAGAVDAAKQIGDLDAGFARKDLRQRLVRRARDISAVMMVVEAPVMPPVTVFPLVVDAMSPCCCHPSFCCRCCQCWDECQCGWRSHRSAGGFRRIGLRPAHELETTCVSDSDERTQQARQRRAAAQKTQRDA